MAHWELALIYSSNFIFLFSLIYFLSFVWIKWSPNLYTLPPSFDISLLRFSLPCLLSSAHHSLFTLRAQQKCPLSAPTDTFISVYLLPPWNWISWGQVLYLICIWSPFIQSDASQRQVYISSQFSQHSYITCIIISVCTHHIVLIKFLNVLFRVIWVLPIYVEFWGSFSYKFLLMRIVYIFLPNFWGCCKVT